MWSNYPQWSMWEIRGLRLGFFGNRGFWSNETFKTLRYRSCQRKGRLDALLPRLDNFARSELALDWWWRGCRFLLEEILTLELGWEFWLLLHFFVIILEDNALSVFTTNALKQFTEAESSRARVFFSANSSPIWHTKSLDNMKETTITYSQDWDTIFPELGKML